MIGPQGSGKGTQSEILAKKLGIPTVSTGQVLRAETDRQTGLGKEIEKYMKTGDLVPSDIISHLMIDRLGEQDTEEGVIVDGYPRTVEQAKTLDDIMTNLERHITYVFYIDLTDEVAIERISGRRVCSNSRCGVNYHVSFKPPEKEGIYNYSPIMFNVSTNEPSTCAAVTPAIPAALTIATYCATVVSAPVNGTSVVLIVIE